MASRAKKPVKAPSKPDKDRMPEWLDTLPEHLERFGRALNKARKLCVELLEEAMEEYDDKIYDAVLDATPKDVLEAMNKGRGDVTGQVDSILAIACACAEDHAPNLTKDALLAQGVEEDPRGLGEAIGCAISESPALAQDMLCTALVGSLSSDARESLRKALA